MVVVLVVVVVVVLVVVWWWKRYQERNERQDKTRPIDKTAIFFTTRISSSWASLA